MSSQSRGFLASPEELKLLQAAKAEEGWTFAAIAERAGVIADTVSRLFHLENRSTELSFLDLRLTELAHGRARFPGYGSQ